MDLFGSPTLVLLLLILSGVGESWQRTSDSSESRLAKYVQVLDDGEETSEGGIKFIANIVCKNNDSVYKQVAKPYTVLKLNEYLSNTSDLDSDELVECFETYEDSLSDLSKIISSSDRNVCSDEVVSLIRDYHLKYISESDHDRAYNDAAAPKMLKIFFIQYALKVSAICKLAVIGNLERQASLLNEVELSSPLLGSVLSELSTYVNPVEKVHDFDDLQLGWDAVLLDGPPDIDPIAKEPVRLYLKVKDANTMVAWQSDCRNKFRPVYGKIIMPVVRLADCGYSANTPSVDLERKRLIDRSSDGVRNWYSVAQICEAILPMRFVSDNSLLEDEVVRLSREEGRALAGISVNKAALPREQKIDYEPDTNPMVYEDELTIKSDQSLETLRSIDLETSIVDRALGRATEIMSRNAQAMKDPLDDMF